MNEPKFYYLNHIGNKLEKMDLNDLVVIHDIIDEISRKKKGTTITKDLLEVAKTHE